MAKVVWATGIDYVSGSLAKPKKKEGHACGTYLLGKHRVAPTTNPNCTTIFVQNADTYVRTSMPSADELAQRTRFAAVATAVAARAKDMTKIIPDKQAFLAQRDNADGKKTLRSYLWSLEQAAYDQAHPQG